MLSLHARSLRFPRFFHLQACLSATTETAETVIKTETKGKSTIKKWTTFWKLLLSDYRDVFLETGKHMKKHPLKSTVWFSSIALALACSYVNPDEMHYRDTILHRSNELIFVSKTIRNPNTDEYLRTIESYFNCGEIEHISFGIFSIVFRNYKCKNSALYKDTCSYTQPTYLEMIRNNIIDIGFWNRWWYLEQAMADYDINPNEWKQNVM